jgi:predicted transcriptional regulator
LADRATGSFKLMSCSFRNDTSISVDKNSAEKLRSLARKDDRTVSSMFRKILKTYEDIENKQKEKQNNF